MLTYILSLVYLVKVTERQTYDFRYSESFILYADIK